MIFPGGTLRVVSPVTEDGNRPKIDSQTGRQVYREDFLPKSARKALEDRNKRLPNHLKKIIELLPVDVVREQPVMQQVVQPTVVTQQTSQPPIIKRKPGPKPKVHA